MIGAKVKDGFAAFLRPLTNLLVRAGVRPDFVTLTGVILSLAAAFMFSTGRLLPAGLLVLTAGLCDVLDGQVAGVGKNRTKFGAFLDSTADRYSEIFIWFGICIYCIRAHWWFTIAALYFALAGSLMVSYVRARAEGLGEECKIGFMQRPERIVLIGAGSLLGRRGIFVVIWLIALLANYTVVERLWHVWKKSKKEVRLDSSK